MEIKTKRLILREYTYDDSAALAEIISDAETMKHYEKPYDEKGVPHLVYRITREEWENLVK